MLHLGAGHDLLTILAVKIILAVGGWLGVLVVGVSYQLVPMFTPSVARPRFLRPVLGLLVAGVLLAALSCLAGAPAWLRIAAAAPYVAGAVLHMADVVRLVAARRDRIVGPVTAGQLCGASLLVVGGLEGCAAMSGAWPWPQVSVVTALLGWAPVLIAANSVRIVPFIVWQGLPRGRRPRTFFPASAHLGWAGVGGALTAWIAMTAAMVTGSSAAARAAGAALLGCSIALAGVSVSTLRGIHGSLTA
ncbi:MAG: hypothetical protein ACREQ5_25505, partial [Candidatus Dormibacteria bacterium]